MAPWAKNLTLHPKRHVDRFSRFAQLTVVRTCAQCMTYRLHCIRASSVATGRIYACMQAMWLSNARSRYKLAINRHNCPPHDTECRYQRAASATVALKCHGASDARIGRCTSTAAYVLYIHVHSVALYTRMNPTVSRRSGKLTRPTSRIISGSFPKFNHLLTMIISQPTATSIP